MATLSANSRRNSSTPTSPSSPRPSIGNAIGNGNLPNETAKPVMQSLHEEDVVPEPIPLPPPPLPQCKEITSNSIEFSNITNQSIEKISKEKSCTERSDSGFSDCSNCSSGNATLAVHTPTNVLTVHPLFDKINSISEEKSMNESNKRENSLNKVKEFGSTVSVNMLKMKLEKMADAQQNSSKNFNVNKKMMKKLPTPFTRGATNMVDEVFDEDKNFNQLMRTSYSFDLDDVDSLRDFDDEPKSLPIVQATKTLMRSASLHQKRIVEKEPIMKSDFTNTIKMRKKSLESNATREKQVHPQRILLEPSGKVSKLLRRFDSQNATSSGLHNDTASASEPIIQTPGIDDTQTEISLHESKEADDEIIEILNTKNVTVVASGSQKSPTSIVSTAVRKSPTKIAKQTIVSTGSGSMKRVIASKQSTNTKTHITSMETKITSQRKSPTKLTNDVSNTQISRAIPKAINNQMKHSNSLKKSHNKSAVSTADAGTVSVVHHASRNASVTTTSITTTAATATTTAATTNKTTAYSSFNRTSPVRLSGRVKQVTDRLSTSKATAKVTSPVRNVSDKKSVGKYTNAHEFNQEHDQNMTIKSISGKIVTVTEAVIETEQHVEHTINGKIDGTFTLKSKMNENFRKASAFWKAT